MISNLFNLNYLQIQFKLFTLKNREKSAIEFNAIYERKNKK